MEDGSLSPLPNRSSLKLEKLQRSNTLDNDSSFAYHSRRMYRNKQMQLAQPKDDFFPPDLLSIDDSCLSSSSERSQSEKQRHTRRKDYNRNSIAEEKRVRFARGKPKTKLYYSTAKPSAVWVSNKLAPKNKRARPDIGQKWQEKQGNAGLLQGLFEAPDYLRLTKVIQRDDVRGIENYLCERLMKQRLLAKKVHMEAVLDLETELRREGRKSPDQMAEALGQRSRELTSHASDFALHLGLADEQVAMTGQNHGVLPDLGWDMFDGDDGYEMQYGKELTRQPEPSGWVVAGVAAGVAATAVGVVGVATSLIVAVAA